MSDNRNEKDPKSTPTEEESQKKKSSNDSMASSMGLLAQVTTLAWNLVIPIIGGVLLGEYLDRRFNSELTWTLSLLVLGIIIALSNLYNLYVEHGREHLGEDEVEDTYAGNKDDEK